MVTDWKKESESSLQQIHIWDEQLEGSKIEKLLKFKRKKFEIKKKIFEIK